MRRAPRASFRAVLGRRFLACLAMGWALLGGPGAPASAEELAVMLTAPPAGEVLFGEVEIAFEIDGVVPERIRRAEIFVDDVFVESLDRPPWRTRFDIGDENRAHRFEVVVETIDGERASALLVSRQIRVDLQVDVPLQQLYVTIEESGSRGAPGQRVLDLERTDFSVFDDGERQQIVTFERGDVPLVALLLVDSSESMKGKALGAAVAGATAFVDRLGELDQAQVVLFADRVLYQTPFTNFPEVLRTGLSGAEASGGTALDDHLYMALERLETRQGRRVVILLSDGVDVSSLLDMEHVTDAARRSRALVYWLRLGGARREDGPGIVTAWRDAGDHRQELKQLERLVEQSGGRIEDLGSVAEAQPAFERILEELREQYVLGYYPSESRDDGSWHEVDVRVPRRGIEIRHRRGYID